jgi:hypothetical protein
MAAFQTVEYILMASLFVSVLLSGYLTVARLFYGLGPIAYDPWIFGMNLALLLQLYDKHDELIPRLGGVQKKMQ